MIASMIFMIDAGPPHDDPDDRQCYALPFAAEIALCAVAILVLSICMPAREAAAQRIANQFNDGAAGATQGPATALWRGRYIGKSTDVANTVKGTLTKEIFYQDLEVGYSFDKFETAITFGVNNIANLDAPRSYANAPINYDIYTYDERGRSYYVRLSAAF